MVSARGSPLLEKALAFATVKHAGQLRKYTGDPYIVHPIAVAETVAATGGDEAAIAAAYLHDTLEDTATTYEELVTEFGVEVASLVFELTDVYTSKAYPHLNRKARVALEVKRLAGISDRAKLVKLADIANNTSTIEEHDPKFAKVYLPEKAAQMEVLK
jgi:(p)ppGpp synthase/HD superfamily hydrolase